MALKVLRGFQRFSEVCREFWNKILFDMVKKVPRSAEKFSESRNQKLEIKPSLEAYRKRETETKN